MRRMLIAETSSYLVDQLVDLFSDEWSIEVCTCEHDAVLEINRQIPDVAILGWIPYVLDPRMILSNCFPGVPPIVMIVTAQTCPDDISAVLRWGVDCVYEKPCSVSALKCSIDLLYNSPGKIASRVVQHLRVLGLNANSHGFCFLLSAISQFKLDMSQQLHNELYCKIAEESGVDERSVEKAIRTAIRNAWKKRNPQIWSKYFPVDQAGDVACPKNKEFIVTLSQLV